MFQRAQPNEKRSGRFTPWASLLALLAGIAIVRLPASQRIDDSFAAWSLENSPAKAASVAVTVIEINHPALERSAVAVGAATRPDRRRSSRALSPLEEALFLQAVLEFQPAVVAIEPILTWRERSKSQEQVFIDQAMRVPRLLIGIELGEKSAHDLAPDDVPAFSKVSGDRTGLAKFPGVKRQPDEDLRLISSVGFVNLPPSQRGPSRAPLLFDYAGEIVPSLALQAVLLWRGVTPAEVTVRLGAQIILPNDWKIPLQPDGTIAINPAAARSVRRLTLDQLLLAAQERQLHRPPTVDLQFLKGQIVILRNSIDPLAPPNLVAGAIATMQSNAYLRRAGARWDWVIIFLAALAGFFLRQISKWNFVLGAIGFGAGYVLLCLGVLGGEQLWLPGFLPLALLGLLVIVRLCLGERDGAPQPL